MSKKLWVVGTSLWLCAAGGVGATKAGGDQGPDLMAQADSTYTARHLRKAADLYIQALKVNIQNYDAAWKASRTLRELAQLSPAPNEQDIYVQAEGYARHAIKLNPQDAEGHFQLSAAIGRRALVMPKGKARVRLANEIKAEADSALALKPQHDRAYHVIGKWHREVANLSGLERFFANTFFGGKLKGTYEESEVYLKKAIALDPNNVGHHLELGKTYIDMKRWELARTELQTARDLSPTYVLDSIYQKEAADLLEEIQDKK